MFRGSVVGFGTNGLFTSSVDSLAVWLGFWLRRCYCCRRCWCCWLLVAFLRLHTLWFVMSERQVYFLRFTHTWECECVGLCCARVQFSSVLVLLTSIPMWNLFDSLTLCFGLFYSSIRFNRNIWLFAVNDFGCKTDC